MSTATLSSPSVTQLTFPWASSSVEEEAVIVAERLPVSAPVVENDRALISEPTEPVVANSLSEALVGDRIGRPFKMGSVMFRLLKSYGITDEEIAAGVAAYNAKRIQRVAF